MASVLLAENGPVVRIERVTKSFPESHSMLAWLRHRGPPPRRVALSDVSLAITSGELFGLLGLNGAGKTTLLKMLCTLTLPDEGLLEIGGIDPVKDSLAVRQRLGYSSGDDRSFYWRLSGRANLELFGTLSGMRGRTLSQRIDEVVQEVNLTDDIDRRYVTYSSGMRQRLSVARALLHDPPILIFDEPTRAVDAKHAQSIRRFLRSLVDRRGKTVILATNSVEEAWELCDRVAIIRRGRIVTIQSPVTLTAQAAERKIFRVMVDKVTDDFLARVKTLGGFVSLTTHSSSEGQLIDVEMLASTSRLNDLLAALSLDGVAIRSFWAEQPRPVDVFVKLATDAE